MGRFLVSVCRLGNHFCRRLFDRQQLFLNALEFLASALCTTRIGLPRFTPTGDELEHVNELLTQEDKERCGLSLFAFEATLACSFERASPLLGELSFAMNTKKVVQGWLERVPNIRCCVGSNPAQFDSRTKGCDSFGD
jgi:hypothetical protein